MEAVREYASPLFLALLLHAGAGFALLHTWQPEVSEPKRVQMPVIRTKLIVMTPKAPTPAPPPPKAAPPPKPEPPKPEPEKPPPKPEPRPEPEKPRADPDEAKRAAEEERRRQQLLDMFEKSTELAFNEEVASQEQAEVDALTMSYYQAISAAIESHWSRPPSARNGMQARLLIELAPSGELLSLTLTESSGNEPFDRSAQAAVRKAQRFEVPKDRRLFEAQFRRFTLLFKPEDLLR